jgi:hypothetical protein
MRFRTIAAALVAGATLTATAALASPASASSVRPATFGSADTTSVALVHGIPGEAGFPVDIYVVNNFKRYKLDNITFGAAGTLEALTGRKTQPGFLYVGILPADAFENGRIDKPILQTSSWLGRGQSRSVVAHLDGNGAPKLSNFVNDVRTDGDNGQVTVHHLAAAPQVGVYVPVAPPIAITPAFVNGERATLEVPAGTYPAVVTAPNDPASVLAGPIDVPIQANKTTLAFAIGDFAAGSFTVAAVIVNAR